MPMALRSSTTSPHPLLTTADLLSEAARSNTAMAWAHELGITTSRMSEVRKAGILRPSHAAIMALKLGQDVGWWVAVSAIEAQPDGPCKRQVLAHLRTQHSTRAAGGRRLSAAPAPRPQRGGRQGTLQLLQAASAIRPLIEWSLSLGLSRNTYYAARSRGHLSPAAAADLASQLGEDPDRWAIVAALEAPGPTRQRLEHALYRRGIVGPFSPQRADELAGILGPAAAAATLVEVIEPEPPSTSKDRVLARLRHTATSAQSQPRHDLALSQADMLRPKSLDLLSIATNAMDVPAWAAAMGLNPNTTGQARRRGSLSAALAGALAMAVGEDVISWVQVAAVEAERDPARQLRMLEAMRQPPVTQGESATRDLLAVAQAR